MVDDLISKIAAESGKEEQDIANRIEAKQHEMSGLVSAEGAAHLIAREEGVELSAGQERELEVQNIVPGMTRVDVKAKVVDISDVRTFERDDSEGKVRNVVLGDETGTIRLTLWDEQVEVAEKFATGDCLHITGAYTREDNRGNTDLRLGNNTQMEMLDEDVVGDVNYTPRSEGREPDRVKIHEITDANMNYEIDGTLVQLYTDNPFYKACPECNKKVDDEGESATCKQHGEVEPMYNMILSVVLDDGHGNVRAVFFRDRAMELLGLDEDPNGNTQLVQERAAAITGDQVRLRGRSRHNDYFDRIELIANEVAPVNASEQVTQRLGA